MSVAGYDSSGYVVVFDDGRFLGARGPVQEYPDAEQFTSRRKAEQAAAKRNLPSTVMAAEEYA